MARKETSVRLCNADIGEQVYHQMNVTWGKGVITSVKKVHKHKFGPGSAEGHIWVRFQGKRARKFRPFDLCRIPNTNQIRRVMHAAHMEGRKAIDMGDHVVFPDSTPSSSKPPILANITPMWELKINNYGEIKS